jgi:hypothetical protein
MSYEWHHLAKMIHSMPKKEKRRRALAEDPHAAAIGIPSRHRDCEFMQVL